MSRNFWVLLFVVAEISSSATFPNRGRRFELEECEELIPHFIDHISKQGKTGECGEVGIFPQPGVCETFFRCVRGQEKILPVLEYCAIGYNFDGKACIRSNDTTDCPQFNCKPPSSQTSQENLEMSDMPNSNPGISLNSTMSTQSVETTSSTTTTSGLPSMGPFLAVAQNNINGSSNIFVKVQITMELFISFLICNFII